MAKQESGAGYYFTPQAVTSQVNWSDVSKQVSDTLHTEAKSREGRRQGIEDATTDTVNTLQESMKSQHGGTNAMAINFASEMTDSLMIAKNQVLNGTMTQREYNIVKNNLMTGSKNMGTMVNSVNDNYAEWQRRTDAGENIASIEEWLASKYYDFGQFGDSDGSSKPYINPMTGEVTMGKQRLNSQGVLQMSKNKDDYATVFSLLGRTKARYKHYDPVASLKTYVGTIGEQINVLSGGNVQIRNHLLQGLGFDDPKNAELKATFNRFAKAQRAYTPNFAAVLADNIITIPLNSSGRYDPKGVEKEFDYTNDPDEAAKSDHWILMTNDNYPVPMLDPKDQTQGTKAQLKMYDDFQIKTMLSLVKKEEKPGPQARATPPPSGKQIEHDEGVMQAQSVVPFLMTAITTNSEAEGRGALAALGEINPNKKYSNYSKTKDAIRFQVSKLGKDPETNAMVWGNAEPVVIPLRGAGGLDENGDIIEDVLSPKQIVRNALSVFTDYHAYVDLSNLQTIDADSNAVTPSNISFEGGDREHAMIPWKNIKHKEMGFVWDDIDAVFNTPLISADMVKSDKTPQKMAERMVRRLDDVVFSSKNIFKAADRVSFSTNSAGRIFERVKMSNGKIIEIQLPIGKYDKDNAFKQDKVTKEELQYVNKLIYNMLVTGVSLDKDVLEKKIQALAPSASVMSSGSLKFK